MSALNPEYINATEQDVCNHGNSLSDLCESCLDNSRFDQPIWNTIFEIVKDSKYKRELDNTPETIIESEGKKYKIELLRNSNEQDIRDLQKMLEETFGEDEVDPIEYLRAGIEGKTPEGDDDVARYRIFMAKDESGNIQSVYAGGLINMRDEKGQETNETMFMGAYGITKEHSRRQGITKELYASSMMLAANDSQAQNKKFSMIAGECTFTSELAWNSVNRRRAYVKTGDNQYSELKYYQPALEFNKKNGLPKKNSHEVAEHIQIQFIDGEAKKERVSSALDAMYRWCNEWSADSFSSASAYQNHKNYIDGIKKEFNDFMNDNGDLILLSAQERQELINKGIEVIEHKAADHGETGPEDA